MSDCMKLKTTFADKSNICNLRFFTQNRKTIPVAEHSTSPTHIINRETATTFVFDIDSNYFLKGNREYTEGNVPPHNTIIDHFRTRNINVNNYVSGVIEDIGKEKLITLAFNNRNLSKTQIDDSQMIITTLKIIFAMNSKNFGKNLKFQNNTKLNVFSREPNGKVNIIFNGTFKEFVDAYNSKGYHIEKIKKE